CHDDANFGVAASWTKNPGRVALISVSLGNKISVTSCVAIASIPKAGTLNPLTIWQMVWAGRLSFGVE
ncbi:hypothetical protein, partial [Pseudomonas aeruginosa]|uniref:hypothetical protein n=1 Tax=Pseudomonas aeruginosa TaxID=287 RepID=UPI0021F1A995